MVRLKPVIPAVAVQSDIEHMQDGIRIQAGHEKDVHVDRYGDDAERPRDHLFPGEQPDVDQSGEGGDQFERMQGSKVRYLYQPNSMAS